LSYGDESEMSILGKVEEFIFLNKSKGVSLDSVKLSYDEYRILMIEVDKTLKYCNRFSEGILPVKIFGINIKMGKESDLR